MKAKSLQFGKAMSAALFILLLVVAGVKSTFAQTQVATLQHGEDISVFYGTNAFVEAHTAAETGDIITLSSGTFTNTNITKAITLRGAGFVADTISGITPTIISGNMSMSFSNDTASLHVEGISFSGETISMGRLNRPQFIRCFFQNISGNSAGQNQSNNAVFVNCIVQNRCWFSIFKNPTLLNCAIRKAILNGSGSNTRIIAYNSIIGLDPDYSTRDISVYNCIVIGFGGNQLNSNCIAYNSIGIKKGSVEVFGSGCQAINCMSFDNYSDVFETFQGSFSNDEQFILKEEIATSFLGTDGAEVGVHGGPMPFTSRPTYMILRRCNVASRSTVDGKLSVEIEVVTEEE